MYLVKYFCWLFRILKPRSALKRSMSQFGKFMRHEVYKGMVYILHNLSIPLVHAITEEVNHVR